MDRFPLLRRHHSSRPAPTLWFLKTLTVFLLLLYCLPASAFALDGLVADFEGIDGVESHAPWQLRGDNLAIVSGGPDGKGHCLRAERTEPGSHCSIRIESPIVLERNLVLQSADVHLVIDQIGATPETPVQPRFQVPRASHPNHRNLLGLPHS